MKDLQEERRADIGTGPLEILAEPLEKKIGACYEVKPEKIPGRISVNQSGSSISTFLYKFENLNNNDVCHFSLRYLCFSLKFLSSWLCTARARSVALPYTILLYLTFVCDFDEGECSVL